jgi:hypothetical protein
MVETEDEVLSFVETRNLEFFLRLTDFGEDSEERGKWHSLGWGGSIHIPTYTKLFTAEFNIH